MAPRLTRSPLRTSASPKDLCSTAPWVPCPRSPTEAVVLVVITVVVIVVVAVVVIKPTETCLMYRGRREERKRCYLTPAQKHRSQRHAPPTTKTTLRGSRKTHLLPLHTPAQTPPVTPPRPRLLPPPALRPIRLHIPRLRHQRPRRPPQRLSHLLHFNPTTTRITSRFPPRQLLPLLQAPLPKTP